MFFYKNLFLRYIVSKLRLKKPGVYQSSSKIKIMCIFTSDGSNGIAVRIAVTAGTGLDKCALIKPHPIQV